MSAAGHVVVLPDRSRVRLGSGSHASPRDGVCVVELASLIAREEFSDRPRCVCPVIAAYLRGWNDRAAHGERQRLVPYATLIVGSRADRKTTRRRRDVCLEWAGADLRRGPLRAALTRLGIRLRIAILCGARTALRSNEGAADYAARLAMARRDASAAFGLLDELLAIGARPRPEVDAATNGHHSANGNAPRVSGHKAAEPANGSGSTNGGAPRPGARTTAGTFTRE